MTDVDITDRRLPVPPWTGFVMTIEIEDLLGTPLYQEKPASTYSRYLLQIIGPDGVPIAPAHLPDISVIEKQVHRRREKIEVRGMIEDIVLTEEDEVRGRSSQAPNDLAEHSHRASLPLN